MTTYLSGLKFLIKKQALLKVTLLKNGQATLSDEVFIVGSEQSDTLRLSLGDITHFIAEHKMVFAHSLGTSTNSTIDQSTAIDHSLDQLKTIHREAFIRAYRNTLVVARHIKRLFHDGTGKYWITVGNNKTPIAINHRGIAAIKSTFKTRIAIIMAPLSGFNYAFWPR